MLGEDFKMQPDTQKIKEIINIFQEAYDEGYTLSYAGLLDVGIKHCCFYGHIPCKVVYDDGIFYIEKTISNDITEKIIELNSYKLTYEEIKNFFEKYIQPIQNSQNAESIKDADFVVIYDEEWVYDSIFNTNDLIIEYKVIDKKGREIDSGVINGDTRFEKELKQKYNGKLYFIKSYYYDDELDSEDELDEDELDNELDLD